jgi:hypothetical protein
MRQRERQGSRTARTRMRTQALLTPEGNPARVTGVADLRGLRVARRQFGTGTRVLLDRLLATGQRGLADSIALAVTASAWKARRPGVLCPRIQDAQHQPLSAAAPASCWTCWPAALVVATP